VRDISFFGMLADMGVPAEKRRYTIEEYLELEFNAEERHEYHDGEILAMAGTSYEHSLIVANLIAAVHGMLKGKPCRILESNLRVRIPHTRRYFYPDATIICGTPQFDPQDTRPMTVINPRVIMEVLSPSSEGYDRGEKFTAYRELETLEEYVLISQSSALMESFFRQGDGTWSFAVVSGLEAMMKIRCLDVEVAMGDVYGGIEWPTEEGLA
jgi:Uma2 family endonuclease